MRIMFFVAIIFFAFESVCAQWDYGTDALTNLAVERASIRARSKSKAKTGKKTPAKGRAVKASGRRTAKSGSQIPRNSEADVLEKSIEQNKPVPQDPFEIGAKESKFCISTGNCSTVFIFKKDGKVFKTVKYTFTAGNLQTEIADLPVGEYELTGTVANTEGLLQPIMFRAWYPFDSPFMEKIKIKVTIEDNGLTLFEGKKIVTSPSRVYFK